MLSLAGLGVVTAAVFVMTYLLAVWTTAGRLLDGASLRGAIDNRSRLSDAVERTLDVVSVTSLLAAAVLLVGIALVRSRRELAVAAVVVVVGANATSQLLKRVVLERPDLGLYESTPATLNSLPSGHSTVAFSLAVALGRHPVRRLAPAQRLGRRPSGRRDLGGRRGRRSRRPVPRRPGRAATHGPAASQGDRSPAGCGGGVPAGVRAIVAAVIVTTQLDTYGPPAQVLAYVAGAGAVSGTGAAIMAALLAVLHLVAPTHVRQEPAQPAEAEGS